MLYDDGIMSSFYQFNDAPRTRRLTLIYLFCTYTHRHADSPPRREIYNIWCGTPCQKRCSARSSELKMSHIIHYASFKLTAECFAAWTVFNVCTAGNKGGGRGPGHQQVATEIRSSFLFADYDEIFSFLMAPSCAWSVHKTIMKLNFYHLLLLFLCCLHNQSLTCNSSPHLRYNTQILNVFLSQLFKQQGKKNKCEVISKLTPLTGFSTKDAVFAAFITWRKNLSKRFYASRATISFYFVSSDLRKNYSLLRINWLCRVWNRAPCGVMESEKNFFTCGFVSCCIIDWNCDEFLWVMSVFFALHWSSRLSFRRNLCKYCTTDCDVTIEIPASYDSSRYRIALT